MKVLRQELTVETCGAHFLAFPDADEGPSFLRAVAYITPKLDLVFPISLAHDDNWLAMQKPETSTFFGSDNRNYLESNMRVCFMEPMLIVSTLKPLIRAASSTPKVIFLTSPIGSITQCGSSAAHGFRAAFAALRALIASLSYEFADGIVLGAFLGVFIGRFAPGCVTRKSHPRAVPAAVAARRLMRIAMDAKAQHSGNAYWHELGTLLPP